MPVGNPADNPANHPSLQDSHQSQNLHHPESLKASSTTTKLSTSCCLDTNKVVPLTQITCLTQVPTLHGKDNLMAQIQKIWHIWSSPHQIQPLHQQTWPVYRACLLPFQQTSQSTLATLWPTYQPTRPTISLKHSPCSLAQSRPHVRLHPNTPKSANLIHSMALTLRSFNPS